MDREEGLIVSGKWLHFEEPGWESEFCVRSFREDAFGIILQRLEAGISKLCDCCGQDCSRHIVSVTVKGVEVVKVSIIPCKLPLYPFVPRARSIIHELPPSYLQGTVFVGAGQWVILFYQWTG